MKTDKIPLRGIEGVRLMEEKSCCHKAKIRTEEEQKKLINRLKRIEGQIRGIEGMVEKNAYCPDIMIQVSAVSAALNSFNKELLAEHINTCVSRDFREGEEETAEELINLLKKVMK